VWRSRNFVPAVKVKPVLQATVLERLVQLLAASVRDGCAPRGCADTYKGGTSRASEGVESRDELGDERTKAAYKMCSI